jgi:hypothetical protein
MEVKIGVTQVNRELTVEVGIDSDAVEGLVTAALADGGVLALTDTKGRRILVPAEKLAYVEVTTSTAGTVGFRS